MRLAKPSASIKARYTAESEVLKPLKLNITGIVTQRLSTDSREVAGVLVALNAVLALVKAGIWILSGSLAVQSDAFNSLSDAVYSVLILAGVTAATREPTQQYPDGFRRVEPFVSLFISLAVMGTAAAIAWNSVTQLTTGQAVQSSINAAPVALVVLLITAGVKYWMYHWFREKGRQLESPSISAIAKDNRNDVFMSVGAAIGIVGHLVGLPWLDAAVSVIVALTIGYTGIQIAHTNIGLVLGKAPEQELVEQVRTAAQSHAEIHGIHDLHAHYDGPQIEISVHIEIEGDMTVERAHEIEVDVAGRIEAVAPEKIQEVRIHLDPASLDEWKPSVDD